MNALGNSSCRNTKKHSYYSSYHNQSFGGGSEADLVEKLRNRGSLLISLVAIKNNEAVGHIAFSPVVIESQSLSFEAVALAPMAVLPAYQKQGIGGQLIRTGIKKCKNLGYRIIIVIGHPTYYPRFGFVPAKPKGLTCEFEVPEEAFMVLELCKGALASISGIVRFQPEFKEAI